MKNFSSVYTEKTYAVKSAISREAFYLDFCQSKLISQKAGHELRIDLSDWLDVTDIDLLLYCAKGFNTIYLTIKHFEVLPIETLEEISNVFQERLVGIELENCPNCSWNRDIKRLLSKSPSIKSFIFRSLPWIDDLVLEQMAKRYKGTLEHLELTKCVNISNNGLFQIGRTCSNLRTFVLSCCPKITDVGLLEMTKKIKLYNIQFSHNLSITDKSMEPLITQCREINPLELINCPKLSDKTMSYLFELIGPTGKRKNLAASYITSVKLHDMPLLTAQSILFLTTGTQSLVTVDIADCPNMNMSQLIVELSHLTTIQHLKLSNNIQLNPVFNVSYFLQGMSKICPTLITLSLIDFNVLLDESIANLMELCEVLDEVYFQNCSIGTSCIESICSTIPNLHTIHITGSNTLLDIDIRCISSVCLRLISLKIQDCPRITNAGFTRCVVLRYLQHLSIGNNHPLECTGQVITFFTIAPLVTLQLSRLTINELNIIAGLHVSTRYQLTSFELPDCIITIDIISYLLSHFVACMKIDLTNASLLLDSSSNNNEIMKKEVNFQDRKGTKSKQSNKNTKNTQLIANSTTLLTLKHYHPFLSYQNHEDYQGYTLLPSSLKVYKRYWSVFRQYERHIKATIIAKGYKHYRIRIKDKQIIKREEWKVVKLYLLIKLQSKIRQFLVYRKISKVLKAGHKINKWLQQLHHSKELKKTTYAILHYEHHLKQHSWSGLKDYCYAIKKSMNKKTHLLHHSHNILLKQQVMNQFHAIIYGEIKELLFIRTARILYEIKFLRKILLTWKSSIQSTIKHQQQLVRIFMNGIPLHYHNSTHQIRHSTYAITFHSKRLISLAWLCLAYHRLERLRIDRMIPMAILHANHSFFQRIVKLCFHGLVTYCQKRQYSKERKVYGDVIRKKLIGWKWFHTLPYYLTNKSYQSHAILYAIPQYNHYHVLQAIHAYFIPYLYRRNYLKLLIPKANQHYHDYLYFIGYLHFHQGIIASRKWREVLVKAEKLLYKHFSYYPFLAWKKYTIFQLTIDEKVIQQYQMKLKTKGFKQIRIDSLLRKDKTKLLIEQIKSTTAITHHHDPTYYLHILMTFIKFQAAVRRKIHQKRYYEKRINELYSVQILQNFFRTFLARKSFMSRYKKRDIREKVAEDNELDEMRTAEVETRYFLYKEHAIITIQRFYRGYQGRLTAFELAVIHFRDKNLLFYQANEHFRIHHEAYLRALQAREQIKHRAAIEIQRVFRGGRVREYVRNVRYQQNVNRMAYHVQHAYKRRLARMAFEANKRALVSHLRHDAARKQRGSLLRSLGLVSKSLQKYFTPVLSTLGLDPISFNYRITELVNDTISDYYTLKTSIEREYLLFKEYGYAPLNRMLARRKIIAAEGWKYQVHEAVRIIESGHEYEGYTGMIVRIDDKLLGTPLYEIRLDHIDNGKQTYVRMTTDALLAYERVQPIIKIRKSPPLTDMFNNRYQPIYGLHPEDPLYCKKNITAVWKIQCCFRQYRAKNIVSRMRYELWKQTLARNAIINQSLSDTNMITMQAHFLTGFLGVRPARMIHNDEIRHALQPGRLFSQAKKFNEKRMIAKEYELKYKDRITFLQKSAMISKNNPTNPRDYFAIGYERMSTTRKLTIFCSLTYGFMKKSSKGIQSILTANLSGIKSLLQQNQTSLVTGTDNFSFKQFHKSSHVRYYKASIYQGEWSGIPLITSLKPHGEGFITFLDGWGFAKEDKVLYLTILRCSHLNAMDFGSLTSDPYCEIQCNGILLQTTIKWKNLNPEYYESFEIDVTNPSAELHIIVKDKDLFGSDDFMGQVHLPLIKYLDGKEHTEKHFLMGEDVVVKEEGEIGVPHHEEYDHGEIEIRIRWSERIYEEDQIRLDYKKRMLIRIQAWCRRIHALSILRKYRKERNENILMMTKAAVKITNTCRIRLARREFKFRYRLVKSAIKIQKRVRIWRAKREFRYRKRRHKAAIIIQRKMRVCLAKSFIRRLKEKMSSEMYFHVSLIQKNIRRYLALQWYHKQLIEKAKLKALKAKRERALALTAATTAATSADTEPLLADEEEGEEEEAEEGETKEETNQQLILSTSVEQQVVTIDDNNNNNDNNNDNENGNDVIPVSSWIATYGIDPDYYLKRNRRITERLFQSLLRMKYVRLVSKPFGVVYVNSYPPVKSEEELMMELQGNSLDPERMLTTNRLDFVSVYIPSFRPIAIRRSKAKEYFLKDNHYAILHIPTCIDLRASVNYNLITIQCFQRQRIAKAEYRKQLRVRAAITKFQRHFRRRYEKLHNASKRITSLFRMILSRQVVRALLKEQRAAMTIQGAYRCYQARCYVWNYHSIANVSVLKATTSVEYHSAEKALEHRNDTFWMAESNTKAEIRIEFFQIEFVVSIWIQTSTYAACPQYVSIYTLKNKVEGYIELYDHYELQQTKGEQWFKFVLINPLMTKYFKLIFYNNYGDPDHIAIRQIRFLRSKERSVKILEQPCNYILNPGPKITEENSFTLSVKAEGFPLPTYQWYCNGGIIANATLPSLTLTLHCPGFGQRNYRCIRCKMMALDVPFNCYHIQCRNCGYLFTYKEVEEFDREIYQIKYQEDELNRRKTGLLTSKMQMQNFQNAKHMSILQDLEEQLKVIETQLHTLRTMRYKVKQNVDYTNNKFTNEGVYYCMIQNIRGRSMKMRVKSNETIVLVEKPTPYLVDVIPHYQRRLQEGKRKKWNYYHSIEGTFRKGRLEGLVCIRYTDGSVYEGPYVSEDGIDSLGQSIPSYRIANHYGRYTLADGRRFEGFNVDNHFDIHNLQLFYRLFFPNGEIYEGNFCDEVYHGIGMFKYVDGSVYEGQWHRGNRFGHGHLRSTEGWTYEGFFDHDRRHRQGVITYPDGSCYLGDWYYDLIQGKGIFITALRDVYQGEMLHGLFHGYGELIYANGSRYIGQFVSGVRSGTGIFMDTDGTEYYGNYKNDYKIGEFIVKMIIPIEEKGQDNYEIRIGLYSEETGELIKWKSRFSNPIATKQFIALFHKNREMFDSVYSMILAKHLPHLPEGIDGNNAQIKQIIFKIRTEAGMLVGQQALLHAQEQLNNLLIPMQTQEKTVDSLKKEIERLSLLLIALDKEANDYQMKFQSKIARYEKDTNKIEQYWLEDPKQLRVAFQKACKKLYSLSIDDYFGFRNHRIVPPFVRKIIEAICYLLNYPTDNWMNCVMLIADAVANARHGDEEALRLTYHCKLAYLMESYQVFQYVKIKELDNLMIILADVRFRADSYYVESTGKAGPILVNWIKTNFRYVRVANQMYETLAMAEEKKLDAYRCKANHQKKLDEIIEIQEKLNTVRNKLKEEEYQLEELQHSVLKANDLLQFISGRFHYHDGDNVQSQDYYKIFEAKLELQRDIFNIEVTLRSLVDNVIENNSKEQAKMKMQAYLKNEEYKEPILTEVSLLSWIREEVKAQQMDILANGYTLRFPLLPNDFVETDITPDYAIQIVSLIVDIIVGKMNDYYNDLASCRTWVSPKGRVFNTRFLYIYTWKLWEEEGIALRDHAAINAWELIFGNEGTCAAMAIEARVSIRMSAMARAQGNIWAKHHPEAMRTAEEQLANEFVELYPEYETLCAAAIAMDQDPEQTLIVEYPPNIRARCLCWMKFHPEEMTSLRDALYNRYAEQFVIQFPSPMTGEIAFKILNQLTQNEEETSWYQYAIHWKEFHMEEYDLAGYQIMQEMCKDFIEQFPLNTYLESTKIIVHAQMMTYLPTHPSNMLITSIANELSLDEINEELQANQKYYFQASSYAMQNQGMLRKGKIFYQEELLIKCNKLWEEILQQTEHLQKGSALLVYQHQLHQQQQQQAALAITNTTEDRVVQVDRFHGFRIRLINKYIWVYLLARYEYDEIMKSLQDMELLDPLKKVLHRIRPSNEVEHRDELEKNFLSTKEELEENYQRVTERLSQWNTYFGWNNPS